MTENVKQNTKRKETDNVISTVKRKFPGPAGILPDDDTEEICSQGTYSTFQEGPWKEMSKDFKISTTLFLYDKFNIAWIKKEASGNSFVTEKAPFLAAILESIEILNGQQKQNTINIILKDLTGTIQGTIQYSLYQEKLKYMVAGSVIVIVQFGVLSCTCDKCDNHHITITFNNLCAIYNMHEKLIIKEIEPAEILKSYYVRKKELESKRIPKMNHSLVSNICLNRRLQSTHSMVLGNKLITEKPDLTKKAMSPSLFVLPKVRTVMSTTNVCIDKVNSPCKKSFTFKKTDILPAVQNTISPTTSNNSSEFINEPVSKVDEDEHSRICADFLEGIDVNSFFEDN